MNRGELEGISSRTASPAGPVQFRIDGMTCGNCARHVTEAIAATPGVASVDVSLESGRATVRWRDTDATEAVCAAVARAGYGAKPDIAPTPGQATAIPEAETPSGWSTHLWFGAGVTAGLMVGDWVFQLGLVRWFQWLGFALGTAVQFTAGLAFYRGAWRQLRRGAANMDTLVALGSSTAWAFSTAALLLGWPGHTYFMEAAAIITLVTLGHWLEARLSTRAAGSLQRLLRLAPTTARRRGADGRFEAVPIAELVPGDVLQLAPGERVPTDGTVREGESAVDESMLTGESMPVEKAAGATILAGTSVINGQLLVTVTATGQTTALAQIIDAVRRAQQSRADIQRLADRISAVFVPVVVLLAVATALMWGLAYEQASAWHHVLGRWLWTGHPPASPWAAAVVHAAAVLIVACPCALGLATPVAIMAATNAAAERGILIRDGIALERAGHIDLVVCDKTGTVTTGHPAVAARGFPEATDEGEQRRRIDLAAALARPSRHPLSQAIAEMTATGPAIGAWQEIRGSGVLGRLATAAAPAPVSSSPVAALVPPNPAPASSSLNFARPGSFSPTLRLGSLPWLASTGVDIAPATEFIAGWSARGATVVGLAEGSRLGAWFALRDPLKPEAASTLASLRDAGLPVLLLSGDQPATVQAVAAELGLPADAVQAGVRPEEKAERIARLQAGGRRVAFVGDGINDAPALEQADLGIAVSRATDVAREAADIVLLRSDLTAVPESIALARAALRTIRQNLFWAFFYNAAAVPLAMTGFLSPWVCALAMGASDLIVVGNALRLRRGGRRALSSRAR